MTYDPGPWWWRARCRLADVLGMWACRLEPKDRSSVSWVDGDMIVIARARRSVGRG